MKPHPCRSHNVRSVKLDFGADLEICLRCGSTRMVVEGKGGTGWKACHEGQAFEKPRPIVTRLFKPVLKPDLAAAFVKEVLQSGYIGEGREVEEFENRLGQFVGRPNVLATNSCTSAIDLALDVIGITKGDYVISTPMTCLATNMPLVRRRAHILWADVDPNTGLIMPDSVKKILDRYEYYGIKAIICVDYAGRPCPVKEIFDAARYSILRRPRIIRDSAHVFASGMGDSCADFTCMSFQAIKFLTTGDGGALITRNADYDNARRRRWFGLDRTVAGCSQFPTLPGGKFHMNDIAAAIGLANWDAALRAVEGAIINLNTYRDYLFRNGKILHVPDRYHCQSPWLFPLLVKHRARFIEHMREHGVETSPVHSRNDLVPAVREFASTPFPLHGVDYFDKHQVCLPLVNVTTHEVQKIATIISDQAW